MKNESFFSSSVGVDSINLIYTGLSGCEWLKIDFDWNGWENGNRWNSFYHFGESMPLCFCWDRHFIKFVLELCISLNAFRFAACAKSQVTFFTLRTILQHFAIKLENSHGPFIRLKFNLCHNFETCYNNNEKKKQPDNKLVLFLLNIP